MALLAYGIYRLVLIIDYQDLVDACSIFSGLTGDYTIQAAIVIFSALITVILWLCFQAREFLLSASRWEREFSNRIVRKTVNFAWPELKHSPRQFVRQGEFNDSQVCTGYYFNNYRGRDLFAGFFSNFAFEFSWIKAEGGSPEKRAREVDAIFHGWFFVVSFPKNLQGETMVYRDVAEKSLGWLGRTLQGITVPVGMELIHLEDAEFERHFKVLSNDQLQARYILTPSFMRKTVELQKRMGTPMMLSFRYNCMYAAFPGVVDYFDTFRAIPFTDPAYTRHLFHAVAGMRALAEDMASNYIMWENDALSGLNVSGQFLNRIRNIEPVR